MQVHVAECAGRNEFDGARPAAAVGGVRAKHDADFRFAMARVDVGQPHVADVPRPVFDGEKDRCPRAKKAMRTSVRCSSSVTR